MQWLCIEWIFPIRLIRGLSALSLEAKVSISSSLSDISVVIYPVITQVEDEPERGRITERCEGLLTPWLNWALQFARPYTLLLLFIKWLSILHLCVLPFIASTIKPLGKTLWITSCWIVKYQKAFKPNQSNYEEDKKKRNKRKQSGSHIASSLLTGPFEYSNIQLWHIPNLSRAWLSFLDHLPPLWSVRYCD